VFCGVVFGHTQIDDDPTDRGEETGASSVRTSGKSVHLYPPPRGDDVVQEKSDPLPILKRLC